MNKLLCNERSKKFVSNPGSGLREMYHGKVLPSGEIELIFDGYENFQEYIDSFREETDIKNLIARVIAGEVDLLNARQGQFIDSIGLPKSYAEVLQQVIDGQKVFEALPVDIKEKFGNDFNQWFAQMDQPEWLEKTGFLVKKEEPVQEEKVE